MGKLRRGVAAGLVSLTAMGVLAPMAEADSAGIFRFFTAPTAPLAPPLAAPQPVPAPPPVVAPPPVAVPPVAVPPAAPVDTGAAEMAFVAKLNALRSSQGLRALAVQGQLFDVARAWSRQMAAARSISHNGSLASQAPQDWGHLGENVGMGPNVQALHDAFVASPEHYHNMVDPGYDSVGVGVVMGATGTMFVTVDFMAPRATAAPQATNRSVRCRKARRGKVVCKAARRPVRRARRR